MVNNWPVSKSFWRDKRVIVTGGAGFLGSFVTEKLEARGAAEIIVPRSADYDLVCLDAIRELLQDTKGPSRNGRSANGAGPVDIIIHLAARVGGIGANR
jgi:GDP-L-fucose synthase